MSTKAPKPLDPAVSGTRGKQTVGNIGEELAVRFLEERGYEIIDRNYRKKWGEIDIVAEKENVIHFVEVKALTWQPGCQVATGLPEYSPEANIRLWKKLRLSRAIRTYLLDHKIPDEQEFQVDIMAIFLDFERKKARIRFIGNVILS